MSYSVAVDLGTTFTAAAVFEGQGPATIVQLGEGRSIPSVAYLAASGERWFGEEAMARANEDPSGLIREFKRRTGDPSPIDTPNGSATAAELTAGLLGHVLDIVGTQQQGDIAAVVLTHPANWSASKRQAFRASFDTAALPPLHLLTEPEAAAAAFAARSTLQAGDIVTVYDLGGGTFDTAILRRTEDQFEIVGQPSGIERLGGIDFDAAVWAHVNRYLEGALDHADRADAATRRGLAELRRSAVQAKEALASASDAAIPVRLPGLETEVRLTRVEFEAMIRPAIADTIGATKRLLAGAGIAPAEVDTVLLVGGSSRIPLVAQLVAAELRRPVDVDARPKESVALGAAAASDALTTRAERPLAESPSAGDAPSIDVGPVGPPASEPPVVVTEASMSIAAPGSRSPRPRWLAPAAAVLAVGLIGAAALALSGGEGSDDASPTTSSSAPGSTSTTSAPPTSTTDTVAASTGSTSVASSSTAVPAFSTDVNTATCEVDTTPFVCMTSVSIDASGSLKATFEPTGFIPSAGAAPNRHIHFFFPTASVLDDERNAGISGSDRSTWIAWDDPTFGPGFAQAPFQVDDAVEAGVTELCVLVAEADHVILPGSGNCVAIPGL